LTSVALIVHERGFRFTRTTPRLRRSPFRVRGIPICRAVAIRNGAPISHIEQQSQALSRADKDNRSQSWRAPPKPALPDSATTVVIPMLMPSAVRVRWRSKFFKVSDIASLPRCANAASAPSSSER
jgi:hypothetical protein